MTHVDIHDLFRKYDTLYFGGSLLANGGVSVRWSTGRMTLCAGLCRYRGPSGGCEVTLSTPLLQFRTNKEIKETLLHEMIHAFLFITNNNDRHDDHGDNFQFLMNKINFSRILDANRPLGGYNITIYHSFHDEVEYHRQHHWECNRCGEVIKRSMNRPPSEKDCVKYRKNIIYKQEGTKDKNPCGLKKCKAHDHIRLCGGKWVKTKEPEKKRKREGEGGGGKKKKKLEGKEKEKEGKKEKEKEEKEVREIVPSGGKMGAKIVEVDLTGPFFTGGSEGSAKVLSNRGGGGGVIVVDLSDDDDDIIFEGGSSSSDNGNGSGSGSRQTVVVVEENGMDKEKEGQKSGEGAVVVMGNNGKGRGGNVLDFERILGFLGNGRVIGGGGMTGRVDGGSGGSGGEVERMMEMGFSEEECLTALVEGGGDLDLAVGIASEKRGGGGVIPNVI